MEWKVLIRWGMGCLGERSDTEKALFIGTHVRIPEMLQTSGHGVQRIWCENCRPSIFIGSQAWDE